ncbi:MAG: 3D domain-containing protein [Dysosmobacter sp.]|uniref:3D domain-containing protein n=1 Tax=Dysosmobacter sp. TaxID=2591382 RepID=UPI00284C5355|nr:3D domain-containing protein [Dysosmobacter sp.]MDR3983161.1 3D domain-containing protein [Dysosmobacter sp.]
MSQKGEKYARSVEARVQAVETRIMDLERRQTDSDLFTRGLRNLDTNYSRLLQSESKRHRHAVAAAQREAARWKVNAALALILLGLTAACCVVYATAQEEEMPQGGPVVQYLPDDGRLMGDSVPALTRCYLTPEETEAAENEMIEAALLARATRIDNVTVTHYDCCAECCGKTDGITASGVRATPGVTVAVDPAVIPLGSDVLVDYGDGEIHYYRADDVGGSVTGNHIDLCVGDHEEADALGHRMATVWWVNS